MVSTLNKIVLQFPVSVILILFFAQILQAQSVQNTIQENKKPVRIYIANDDHTDLMWTADDKTYEKVFVEMLDYYLNLAEETDGNPSPFKSRFNADGSYWLWIYERNKPKEEFEKLIDRIKEGSINAPLTALVSCYGAQPAEAVLRGMYYAGRLERKYNLRFTQAVAMENQGLPLGLASLWAGSGARYSWRGVCGCASRMNQSTLYKRDNEIYWACGKDNQKLLMKWHSLYSGMRPDVGAIYSNQHSGGYAEAFNPVSAIKFLDSDSIFLSRYRAPGMNKPYSVRGAFGFGWDALDRKTGVPYVQNPENYPQTDHFHVIAQTHTTSERQVIASNQEDFFLDFEENYGKVLPAESISYGNEWDLYSASMIETSASVKRAVEKLRSAEALATLVSLKDAGFLKGRDLERDNAFMNLGLYWEHDWTADGPVSRNDRAVWQEKIASGIAGYPGKLINDAIDALGEMIAKEGENPRFFVFNPLGWVRSDVADIACKGSENIHVWDLSANKEVPHQIIELAGKKFIRIQAVDLPPVGYKVFEIRPGKGKIAEEPAAKIGNDGRTIENGLIKLTIAPDGSIVSLVDKTNPDFDFVSPAGGLGFNNLNTKNSDGEPVTVINSGPVSVTVSCKSKDSPAHRTSITLYKNSERIDIYNEITENFADVQHWSFGFNLDSPVVHTEETGAVIKVKTKAEGGDYADRNARYDYASLNHYVDISDGNNQSGISISSPDLSFFRLGESTPEHLDTKKPQIHVLAGGQVDKGLGIIAQNGAKYFLQRFAILPHKKYNPTTSMKFALEHQNPPVTGIVKGFAHKDLYPENQFSLLKISGPDVLLWALKPHEDGIENGVVARVWNQSDKNTNSIFSGFSKIKSAQRLTHIETPIDTIPVMNGIVNIDIGANRMTTFKFMFETK